MMFCKNCGKQIEENTKFCVYCGAKQVDTSTSDVQNGSLQDQNFGNVEQNLDHARTNTFYCTNCGKQIEKNTKFCVYCGAKQMNSSSSFERNMQNPSLSLQNVKNTKSASSLERIIIILVVLLVIACIASGIWFGLIGFPSKMFGLIGFPSKKDGMGKQSTEVVDARMMFGDDEESTQKESVTKKITTVKNEKTTTTMTQEKKPYVEAYAETYSFSGYEGSTVYLYLEGDFSMVSIQVHNREFDSELEYLSKEDYDGYVQLNFNPFAQPQSVAYITPYNDSGVAGEVAVCEIPSVATGTIQTGGRSYAVDNMKGQITCHGGTVAGFTTDYVVNGGSVGMVRGSLGDTWHVTAKNKCYNYGVTWYELWDSDDGDYYGWVDSNYIDFY